jgi:hypothetical protein
MARILTLLPGTISARSNNDEVVMVCSIPMVQGYFNISDLQRWITTLEETMVNEKSMAHQHDLENMRVTFQAMLIKHQDQHEEVISAAPTADDLQAYLASYAAATTTPSSF